jgi:hypothetical protein
MPAAKISVKGYHSGMVLRRTPHTVYDTLYHLVWSPKYRRDVWQGAAQQRVRELFADTVEQYDILIDTIIAIKLMQVGGGRTSGEAPMCPSTPACSWWLRCLHLRPI